MNIALIDDGINEDYYNTGKLADNIEITPDLVVRQRESYDRNKGSHGTKCAAIIKKYCPGAVLSSIKILSDRSRRAECGQLVQALKWCAENGVKLVNVSLGSIAFKDFSVIESTVNRIANRGVIVVAACNNEDIITYPASLSNVIGVKCDKSNTLREKQYTYKAYPYDGIEVVACGSQRLIKGNGEPEWAKLSNSFAAPVVTALAGNFLQDHPGAKVEDIKKWLARNSQEEVAENYNPCLSRKIDWVENAVAFSLNSETTILSDFYVGGTLNIKCDNNLTGMVLVKDYIQSHPNILAGYDTIVISLDLASSSFGSEETDLLSTIAHISKKNVVLISDNLAGEGNFSCFNRFKVWHPAVYNIFKPESGIKEEIVVPVIAIHDFTGKNAIRFTRELGNVFTKNGYNCAAASNKITAAVAGFEYIPLDRGETERGIASLHSYYKPDLILFGVDMPDKAVNNGLLNIIGRDLSLLIVNRMDENVYSVINALAESHIPLIIIGEFQEEELSDRSLKCFNTGDVNLLSKVYNHILFYFESEK